MDHHVHGHHDRELLRSALFGGLYGPWRPQRRTDALVLAGYSTYTPFLRDALRGDPEGNAAFLGYAVVTDLGRSSPPWLQAVISGDRCPAAGLSWGTDAPK